MRKIAETVQDKAERRKLLARLDSPAYRARLNRLEALKTRVEVATSKIADERITRETAAFKGTFRDSYNLTQYDIQRELGFGFAFDAVPEEALNAALYHKWSGAAYSERVWENTHELAKAAKDAVQTGLLTGRSTARISTDLAEQFDTEEWKAARVIRTEMNYFCNQGAVESYKAAGVTRYRFLATLDARTCKVCGALDGQEFEVDKLTVGQNYPPLHPNDRCTTTAVVEGASYENAKRRARDPKTGEPVLVPRSMTYPEWVKMQREQFGVDIDTERQKAYNRVADMRQFERYKEVLGADAPQAFVDFQRMKYEHQKDYIYAKGLVSYLREHPNSNKKCYDAQIRLSDMGIRSGVLVPPKREQAFILPSGTADRHHIMNRMLERGITDDDVRGYVSNARAMFIQWNGARQVYIGDRGACTIVRSPEWSDTWVFRTAWSEADYDEREKTIMEVLGDAGL